VDEGTRMSRTQLVEAVLEASPRGVSVQSRGIGIGLAVAGVAGIGLGFAGGAAGWVSLLVATSLVIGLAAAGVVFSAIFQLTGARWGRPYRRLAEAGVVLMPIGLVGIVVLLLGGQAYLPWAHAHHLPGGKEIWLTRGFWDARILLSLAASWGLCLAFVYYSLRRDFCVAQVSARFGGWLGRLVSRGISDPERERARCDARMSLLAPMLVTFALMFTVLAVDLVMSLEPDWFSTLFGGWFFIGHVFSGLAILGIVGILLGRSLGIDRFIGTKRRADLATVLFGFCLVTTDFFWSQYLTIWYANLPEETGWIIERTIDPSLPWSSLSWVTLLAFFAIPFIALLFRKVKETAPLLAAVAVVVVVGIFLARFLEIAPALLDVQPGSGTGVLALPLLSAVLTFAGFLGGGMLLYQQFLTWVPVMPVGDDVFRREFGEEEP